MKRVKLTIVYGLIMLSMFTGCGTQKSKENGKENQAGNIQSQSDAAKDDDIIQVSFPSEYKKNINNVLFSCSVLAPETPVLTVTKAKKMEINRLELAEYLIQSRNVSKTTIWNEDGTDSIYDGKMDLSKDQKSQQLEFVYWLGDGSLINVEKNGVLSFADSVQVTEALNLGEEDEGYNGDLYLQDRDFTFATEKEVLDEFQKIIHEYTDVEDTQPVVYCVDADSLNKNRGVSEAEETGGSETSFTHADDGYYICMRQQLQGIPVFPREKMFYTEYAGNAPIIGYYTINGWQELIVDGKMLYTFEVSDKPVKLKEFDEIAETVSEYYNAFITENTYEVYRATLYNYVTEDGCVTPVWIFKIYEKYPDGNFRCDQLDINAVTGEVFTVYD